MQGDLQGGKKPTPNPLPKREGARTEPSLALLLILSLLVILPAAPFLNQTPNNDYAIFSYVGSQVADGKLPYRDAFDHKPPLIFYLDAAGLLLAGKSRWGIWAVQCVSLLAVTGLSFALVKRYFGRLAAVVAVGVMLLNLAFVHERGNLTEEYALPLQLSAVLLLARAEDAAIAGAKPGWHLFGVGVMVGLAASLKQTLAGMGAAIIVYLFCRAVIQGSDWRGFALNVLRIVLGIAVVWLVWLIYFAALGIFAEFWEAAFLMNFGYSQQTTLQRLQAMTEAVQWLGQSSGFFVGGLLIWLAALAYLIGQERDLRRVLLGRWSGAMLAVIGMAVLYNGLFRGGLVMYQPGELSPYRVGLILCGGLLVLLSLLWLTGWLSKRLKRFTVIKPGDDSSLLSLPLLIAVVDLPLEFLLATFAGRNYPHYFMPLLPALTLLFGFAVHSLINGVTETKRGMAYVWLAVLLLPVVIPGIAFTGKQWAVRGDRQVEAVAAYLKANTQPSDRVLQWGISSSIYLLAERESASRYFTTNPLFFDGYSDTWQTSRLLSDLQTHPPVVIIDAQMNRLPLVTNWQDCPQVKDPAYYQAFLAARKNSMSAIPQMTAGIGEVYEWICENYAPSGPVGELGWLAYRWKGR